ncbi:MAG TPA: hypothetical protein VKS60_15125 [Stellaceae bacterium]|nr:hypothetical protein [Stellaceae bacterium]
MAYLIALTTMVSAVGSLGSTGDVAAISETQPGQFFDGYRTHFGLKGETT